MAAEENLNSIQLALLNIIPDGLKNIVEVGCQEGKLGRLIKNKYPDLFYVGLENSELAANIAKKYIDDILVGDLENINLSDLEIEWGKIDCLMYNGSLEKVKDPWSLLKRHCSWLGKNGAVIANISNFQNMSLIELLLRGEWQYSKNDIINKDQLRFFTLSSIREMFVNVGLKIENILVVRQATNQQNQQLLFPLLRSMQIDYDQFVQYSAITQYIIKANKV